MVGPPRLWSLSSFESFVDPQEHAMEKSRPKTTSFRSQTNPKQLLTYKTIRETITQQNTSSFLSQQEQHSAQCFIFTNFVLILKNQNCDIIRIFHDNFSLILLTLKHLVSESAERLEFGSRHRNLKLPAINAIWDKKSAKSNTVLTWNPYSFSWNLVSLLISHEKLTPAESFCVFIAILAD